MDRKKEINELLDGFFKDKTKLELWLNSKNPFLGGLKPSDMMVNGREKKLLKFIKLRLEENKRG